MLILISILLVAFGVISGASKYDFCGQGRPEHCFTDDVEVDFPDSVEALDKVCPVLISRFKCLVDFKNKCGDEANIHYEHIEPVYDLVVEACNEESTFHKELSVHLPCIEEVLMSHRNSCKLMVEEALEEITSGLSLETDEEHYPIQEDDWRKYYCFSEALDVACFVASLSVRCGEKATDMVAEVVDRIEYLDVFCPESIQEEVKEAVSIVMLEMEVKLATEEIMSEV